MSGVAKETFQVLLRFDYVVKLYDQDGMVVAEPTEARRMFASKPNLMVTLDDADDDSCIKLLFGKSTHANDIDGLIQALRTTATKYNMSFEDKQFGKEIGPKDYKNIMSVSESKREKNMAVCEGMYGTSRSSYLLLDNAKVIVHHNERINLTEGDARARNIGSIFIEDANGNRMTFPTTDLKAARAIAEHIDQGGTFDDDKANAIMDSFIPPPPEKSVPYLAENHPAIRDFMDWTMRFEPTRALSESNDPYDPFQGKAEDAEEQALSQFHPDDFMQSKAYQHMVRFHHPNSGEDSEVDKDEVISTLAHYLTKWIESHMDAGYFDDTTDMAVHLYSKVADAMHAEGFTIVDGSSGPQLHETPNEAEEFTREDILLPNKDEGGSLSREVSKSMVHDDPANPDEEHPAGDDEIRRMRTLAGISPHNTI